MAAKHGTRRAYVGGCRCDDCAAADRAYKREYRQRKAAGAPLRQVSSAAVVTLRQSETLVGPGPVEVGVQLEIEGLAQTEARPGLAQMALELARVMDNPRAINQKAAASKALGEVLDKLRKGADERRSRLASVRSMTGSKSATG